MNIHQVVKSTRVVSEWKIDFLIVIIGNIKVRRDVIKPIYKVCFGSVNDICYQTTFNMLLICNMLYNFCLHILNRTAILCYIECHIELFYCVVNLMCSTILFYVAMLNTNVTKCRRVILKKYIQHVAQSIRFLIFNST
jgi:hypothetical protein